MFTRRMHNAAIKILQPPPPSTPPPLKYFPLALPPQDLVVPSFKGPAHYHASPLIGNAPVERDILLFFKVRVAPPSSPYALLPPPVCVCLPVLRNPPPPAGPCGFDTPFLTRSDTPPLFFQGDAGERRQPNYSRGVRQRLHK